MKKTYSKNINIDTFLIYLSERKIISKMQRNQIWALKA